MTRTSSDIALYNGQMNGIRETKKYYEIYITLPR